MRRLRLLLYIVFGVGLALFVVATAIFNLTKVRVETAIVSAEILTLRAPSSGNIKDVFCADGESVTEGTILVPLENPKLEKEIIEANHDFEKETLVFEGMEKNLRAKMEAFQARKESLARQMKIAEERMEITKTSREQQDALLVKAEKNRRNGRVSSTALDVIREKAVAAQLLHLSSREAYEELAEEIKALESGLYFEDGKAVFQDFEGEIANVNALRAAGEKKRNALRAVNSDLTVKAPATGKILKVLVRRNSFVEQGDPLIRLEEEGPMYVKVILSREQYNSVKVDSSASVFLPAKNRRFDAKVSNIELTGTAATDLKETFQISTSEDGNVVVTLAFVEEVPRMESGLPATVTFNKGLTKGVTPGAGGNPALATKGL